MSDRPVNLTSYVQYRLEKAEETYHAAQVLYDAERKNYIFIKAFF